ncbi:MAG: hypothetical protein LBB05_00730 [Puniceicoccales bacterium]|jgi:hypothetical protein|nr:hypothetical protein [Puniceicoccales bacterium]
MTNKIIKIKKELKNNIIGSLLLGSSIAAITQAQASQRLFPPSDREIQEVREKRERVARENKRLAEERREHTRLADLERKKQVTEKLRNKLTSEKSLSTEECIPLIKGSVSGNVDCGNLTFLEEAILSKSWQGVRAAIENKAYIDNISKCLKERYGKDFTLLHLAVLLPEEMKELCQLKRIDKEESLLDPHVSSDVVDELLKAVSNKDIMIRASELVKNNINKINDPNIKKEYKTVAQRINEKITEMIGKMIGITKEEGPEAIKKWRKTNETKRQNARENAKQKRNEAFRELTNKQIEYACQPK